jgi:hypothetical protein
VVAGPAVGVRAELASLTWPWRSTQCRLRPPPDGDRPQTDLQVGGRPDQLLGLTPFPQVGQHLA